MNRLAAVVWEMQALLVVCPCCHQTFRLVEARLSFPARPAHASEYTRVLALESDAQVAMERATAAEQRLETWLATARRERTEAGRRAA
jgi:hypothetical protein